MARYISPFILRRKKEEVLPDLPDLIEITHQSELSDAQKAIYLAQLQQMQQGLISASDQEINRRKVENLVRNYPLTTKSVIPQLSLWTMREIAEN